MIAAFAVVAYHNSFFVPLVLDDAAAITENRSIENLRNLGAVFSPPNDVPTAGRPLLNLSFAFNYALGGRSVIGYHLVNLALHIGCAWLLFGLVRRTLRAQAGPWIESADAVAATIALIWTVHPVHTASVTYLSQRAEVMMGFFLLLMLYAFARSGGGGQAGWRWVSVAACAAGMMTKETMVVAPVLVLLYDRAFFAGRIRDALGRRVGYYAALAGSWLVLAGLMWSTRVTSRGIGYSETIDLWIHLLTQCRVVVSYLKLTFWPHPLVFDHGPEIALTGIAQAWPYIVLLTLTGVAVVRLWRRTPPAGFAALAFFLALAPTSSVVPVTHQPMAENRLYLPAAAVIALAVCAGRRALYGRAILGVALLVMAFTALTVCRNRDYRDVRILWADTVVKRPQNVRARSYLGDALWTAGDPRAARSEFERALRLDPDYPPVHNNLGLIFLSEGALSEALAHFQRAVKFQPASPYVRNNVAVVLMQMPGREEDAVRALQKAIRLKPDYADAHKNLANVLMRLPGRANEAVGEYAEALRLGPNDATAHANLAFGLAAVGRGAEARKHFETALRLNPNHAQAHANLANLLVQTPAGLGAAIGHYRRAVELDPKLAEAWANLGLALGRLPGRRDEAIAALQQALRLRPDMVSAQRALERMEAAP
ncbi:MAG: tetratricopeptide repeat protein [Opitutaceae bacterium]|nr:tetratricopeptide repeat protein [Opitutaceae bacterium]